MGPQCQLRSKPSSSGFADACLTQSQIHQLCPPRQTSTVHPLGSHPQLALHIHMKALLTVRDVGQQCPSATQVTACVQ